MWEKENERIQCIYRDLFGGFLLGERISRNGHVGCTIVTSRFVHDVLLDFIRRTRPPVFIGGIADRLPLLFEELTTGDNESTEEIRAGDQPWALRKNGNSVIPAKAGMTRSPETHALVSCSSQTTVQVAAHGTIPDAWLPRQE